MPIGYKYPQDNPDDQKHKDQHQNPVSQWEGIAAGGANRAGHEPVDVEEDGYHNEKRKRSVDNLFGVMLEQQEQKETNGHTQEQRDHQGPYQILQETGTRRDAEENPVASRSSRELHAGSGVEIVDEGGETGVAGVAVEDGEDAETEGAEDEDEEENEER